LVAVLALILVVSACGDDDADSAAPAGDPIIFGVLEDNAGGAAFYSQQGSDVVRLAIDQINAEGGLLGRPVEAIFGSDDNDPTQAPVVVKQLLDRGADVILLNSGSASALESKAVVKEAEVVGLAPLNMNTNIALPPDNEYSFMIVNPITDIGQIYANAFTAQGYQTIGIYQDDTPTMDAVTGLLTPFFTDAGIEIVAHEIVPTDALDVTPQVQRIMEAAPDVAFVSTLGGQPEVLFFNTAQALGYDDTPFFSLASVGNQPETWDLAEPNALNDMVFAGSIATDNPKVPPLVELLEENIDGFRSLSAYQAQMWDAVFLLADAIERAGSTEGPALKAALESTSGFAATFGQAGFTLSYGADKHSATDGLCGIVLVQFSGNEPGDPWELYQPEC
jgi:branched-chain amino acid transport system substrate-binding protein